MVTSNNATPFCREVLKLRDGVIHYFTWVIITLNKHHEESGGVYMGKLAPARVSYRHDFLISYRVYMMTGSFHISLFEGTLHVDKMHV